MQVIRMVLAVPWAKKMSKGRRGGYGVNRKRILQVGSFVVSRKRSSLKLSGTQVKVVTGVLVSSRKISSEERNTSSSTRRSPNVKTVPAGEVN